MGWQNLCTSENAMADRARFIDAYNASVNTYVSDTRMLPSVKQVADKYALQAGEMVKGLADKWSTK
jgi:cytochrome c551/c552